MAFERSHQASQPQVEPHEQQNALGTGAVGVGTGAVGTGTGAVGTGTGAVGTGTGAVGTGTGAVGLDFHDPAQGPTQLARE